MASADWDTLSDGLASSSLVCGITNGIARPNGGGSFIFGFNSLDASEGVVGRNVNQLNYNPTAKGGSIMGALQRGASAGQTGFAPFLFLCLQGASVNDTGYLLGLGDGDPSHIILRKGSLATGLPDAAPGTSGVLRRSSLTYPVGTWLHLRLDVIVNGNGDVVLNVYQSDLAAHAVTSPTWTAIAGMDRFIDDALRINSGSAPLLAGKCGMAFWKNATARRGYVDQVVVARQV